MLSDEPGARPDARAVFLPASQASRGKAGKGTGPAGPAVLLGITLWVRNLCRDTCVTRHLERGSSQGPDVGSESWAGGRAGKGCRVWLSEVILVASMRKVRGEESQEAARSVGDGCIVLLSSGRGRGRGFWDPSLPGGSAPGLGLAIGLRPLGSRPAVGHLCSKSGDVLFSTPFQENT